MSRFKANLDPTWAHLFSVTSVIGGYGYRFAWLWSKGSLGAFCAFSGVVKKRKLELCLTYAQSG
jgi:hypothetical protein